MKKNSRGNVSQCSQEQSSERKTKSIGYKCILIALDFPFEFRDFLCIYYSRNTNRAKKKKRVGNLSECSLEKCSGKKKYIYGVEVYFHCS